MTPREELEMLRRQQGSGGVAGTGTGAGSTPPPASAPAGSQTFQRASGRGPMLAGAGDALLSGALGLKQLVGLGSDNDKAVLEQMRLEKEADPESGWRTAGNIGGNILATALPGAAAAKGIQGAKVLANFPRLAAILGAGGSSGATEFALAPGEGDSYGEQLLSKSKEAAKAAAAGSSFAAGLGALTKVGTGMFKANPEAEKMFRQGINPTLQQGAAGAPGRFIGGLTSGMGDIKRRLRNEAADAHLLRATERNVEFPKGKGTDFLSGEKHYVQGEYDKIWDKAKVNISPKDRVTLVSEAGRIPPGGEGIDEAAIAAKIVANRMGVVDGVPAATTNRRMSPQTARDMFYKPLSADAFEAKGQVRERLLDTRNRIKDILQRQLPKDKQARLKEVDSLNFDAKRMEEAMQGGRLAKEGVDIGKLNTAYESKLNQAQSIGNTTWEDLIAPAARTIDNTPNQDMSRSALSAARKLALPALAGFGVGGTAGMAAAVAPLYGISALGQSAAGSRFLLGQGQKQKALEALLRKHAAEGTIGGAFGSTITDNQE